MKHKPIFRLSLLALLLAGCGKDTTELPEGPETPRQEAMPSSAGCRSATKRPTPRTKPVRLTAATGRLLPDLLAQCRPRGNHLSADDPAMGGGRSQRLRGDRKRSRPERHGNAVGSSPSYDFYAFYPQTPSRPTAARSSRRQPRRTDLPQRRMQHAVRLYGGMHPRVERGGEVPFRFRPLMTTVTIQVGFSEAAEVQKLVLSSENGPIAGRLHVRPSKPTGARLSRARDRTCWPCT